jgi:thiol-disulfide isomerase/thioredoxin
MKFLATLAMLCIVVSTHAARLRGTIVNRLSDTVEVSWWDMYSSAGESRKAALDKDGNFTLEVPTSFAYNDFTLRNGDEETDLILTPDADLVVSVDASRFDESIRYSGKGSEIANFAATRVRERGRHVRFSARMRELAEETPQAAVEAGNRAVNDEASFLEKNGPSLPDGFQRWWNAHFTYNLYSTFLQYPFFREVQRLKSYEVDSIPAENYTVLDAVPLRFDDQFIGLISYGQYVTGIHAAKDDAKNRRLTGEAWRRRDSALRISALSDMPPATAEHFLAQGVKLDLHKSRPLTKGLSALANFKASYPTSRYLAMLEGHAADRKRLAPGQPAPDFTFTTTDGKKMRLSDLKGNVVLLDLWASWCGPCIGEIPHAKKLEEHFKGKPVTFLAVSIDENELPWKAAMKKYKLTGMHTRVHGGWKAEPMKLYSVSGVPAYFLIDRAGNLANESEPRPSNGDATVKMIEALLK